MFREHETVAPSVLDGSQFGHEEADSTDTDRGPTGPTDTDRYIPLEERAPDVHAELTVTLFQTTEGELVMPAYTSLAELVASCGDGQPWARVRENQVEELRTAAGADAVLWDAGLPLEARHAQHEEGNRG